MHRLSEGLILHIRQHEIVWKYIIWTYSGTEEAELWQSRQSRSAFTSMGMKADLKCETTDLLQSKQKGRVEAELPVLGNEGRVLVEKPLWQSRLSKSAEARLQIFRSPGREEMRKRNFTYLEVLADQYGKRNFRLLPVKAERKCGCGTSHFWQSMQNESAEVEVQIFGSQGRAEVRKRNIRSLTVKAEQKCGSGFSDLQPYKKTERMCGSSTADLWQSRQVGCAEADLNIFDRLISYWLSLPMWKNNSTDCCIEGQCDDHVWLKHMTFAMRLTRSICFCKGSG